MTGGGGGAVTTRALRRDRRSPPGRTAQANSRELEEEGAHVMVGDNRVKWTVWSNVRRSGVPCHAIAM